MNTTLRTLNDPRATLESKKHIFDQLKRQYYNDDIDFDTLVAYNDLIYGTQTRDFGDLSAIPPIHVPHLDEGFSKAEIPDFSELYLQAFDLNLRGVIEDNEFFSLFPIRAQSAARIRAHAASFAATLGFQAVAEAV